MIQKIFVPVENSPYSQTALDYACYIAKHQNARVTVGIIVNISGIDDALAQLVDGKIIWNPLIDEKNISEAKNHIKHFLNLVKKQCEKANIDFSFIDELGIPSNRIYNLTKFFDLTITGLKSDFNLNKKSLSQEVLLKILDSPVSPVLVVPEHFSPIKNISILFDGSSSSARALQRFAHTAKMENYKITVLMSSDNYKWAEENIKRAKNYLAAYGAKSIIIEWTKKDIFETIKTETYTNSDLVVLGLHSKKYLKDFFVGSLTKYLLKYAKKPLFIGV